jgi:hypothetical protein
MYNLDMLKSNGIPRRSTPLLTIAATVAISGPLMLCVLMGIEYMSNQVQIRFNSQMLTKIQQKVETTPYDERLNNRLHQQLGVGLETIDDIITGVERNIQWPSVLAEITSSLPENLAIADIDVRRDVDKVRIPDPAKEGRKKEVEVVLRTLKMTVFNLKPDKNNEDAQNYIRSLNTSAVLKKDLQSAKIAMIKVEDFGEQMLPCYLIECVFRSGYKPGELEG